MATGRSQNIWGQILLTPPLSSPFYPCYRLTLSDSDSSICHCTMCHQLGQPQTEQSHMELIGIQLQKHPRLPILWLKRPPANTQCGSIPHLDPCIVTEHYCNRNHGTIRMMSKQIDQAPYLYTRQGHLTKPWVPYGRVILSNWREPTSNSKSPSSLDCRSQCFDDTAFGLQKCRQCLTGWERIIRGTQHFQHSQRTKWSTP